MASVRSLLVRITGDGTQLEKELTKAAKKVDAVGRRMESVGRDLSVKFTAPILAAGFAAAKLGTDFDTEMTKIVTLVGIAEEQVDAWREALVRMSGEVGRGPNELARALQAVTSAGETSARALEIVELSAKASAVGLGDTATVAKLVTAALQAYGSQGLTAAQATDILVQTVREGAAEADELAGVLGNVLGIAAQVGVGFEELGAFVGVFTRLGVPAEEAVTALRGTLATVLKPTTQAAEALKGMGSSVEELRARIADEGLVATLISLVRRAEETGTEIATIVPNVRALSGVLGTAGVQGEAFVEVAESIRDSAGALEDAFSRVELTPAHTFAQLRATIEAIAVTLGDELAPALNEALRAALPYLRAIRDLDEETLQWLIRVGALTAVLGPLVLGMGAAARTAVSLAQVIMGVRAAAVALGSATLPGAAVMIGLGLLAKHFVDARLEAVRAAMATGTLRAEIMALGSEARRERGIAVALGIIELEERLAAARERLREIQRQALEPVERPSMGFAGDATPIVRTDELNEATAEVEALTAELEGLRRELAVINEVEGQSAEQARELREMLLGLGHDSAASAEGVRTAADVLRDLDRALATATELGALSDAFDEDTLAISALQKALRELVEMEGDHEEQIRAVAGALEERRAQMLAEAEEQRRAKEAEAEAQRTLNEQLAEFHRLMAMAQSPEEGFAQTVNVLRQLEDAGAITAEEFQVAFDAAQRNLEELRQAAGRELDALQSFGVDVAFQLGDAFADFATGSGDAFKAFVDGAIRDLARLTARFLVFKALSAAIPGFGGAFGPLLGFRAAGGPVSSGRPYIVGERGPELFVPHLSGTIVPNGQLQGGGADAAAVVELAFARMGPPPGNPPPQVLARERYWQDFGSELVKALRHNGDAV